VHSCDECKGFAVKTIISDKTDFSNIQVAYCEGVVTNKYAKFTNINISDLVEKLKNIEIGTKEGSYFLRTSLIDNTKGRSDKNTKNTANLLILDADSHLDNESGEIVEGAPCPFKVHENLKKRGIKHFIVRSHSHGKKGNRYRVIFITETAYLKGEFEETVTLACALCHPDFFNSGENTTWSQPWYLPRKSKNDTSKFTYLVNQDGKNLTLQKTLKYDFTTYRKQYKTYPDYQSSPIDKYNEQYSIDNRLSARNDKKITEKLYLASSSTSDQAGISVKDQKMFSHHSSDPLCDGKAHDSFDVMQSMFKFSFNDAVIYAAKNTTMPDGETVDHYNKRQFNLKEKNKNTATNIANVEHPEPLPEWKQKIIDAEGTNEIFNKLIALVIIEGKSCYIKLSDYSIWEERAVKSYYLDKLAYDKDGKKIGKKGRYGFSHDKAFAVWSNWKDRNKFSGVVFDPSFVGNLNKKNDFNLYRGMSVIQKKGSCKLILEHIKNVWCKNKDDEIEYLINWLARMVQQPHKQAQTAITVAGLQGTGKGVIIDMLQDFFSHHSFIATKTSDISSNFNDKLATSIFVNLNEAIWGGDKENEGALKALITDKTLLMERKYLNKVTVKNCTHLIISTNNEYYAPLNDSDRRYVTLTMSNEKRGDFKYFDELLDEIKNGGKQAFLHHLLNVDISDFKPRERPEGDGETKAERGRLKLLNHEPFVKWIVDFLAQAEDEDLESIFNQFPQTDFYEQQDWRYASVKIIKSDLTDHYTNYCKKHNLHIETMMSFLKKLTETLEPTSCRPYTLRKSRKRCYEFMTISECKVMVRERKFFGDNPFIKSDQILTIAEKREQKAKELGIMKSKIEEIERELNSLKAEEFKNSSVSPIKK
jgi:hypothetical protein